MHECYMTNELSYNIVEHLVMYECYMPNGLSWKSKPKPMNEKVLISKFVAEEYLR